MKSIAIIGSGPTAIYFLKKITSSNNIYRIVIYEHSDVAGIGTPYNCDLNSNEMLANICSKEIPPLIKSYYSWMIGLDESILHSFDLDKDKICERGFYPRVLLGMYFKDQLDKIVDQGLSKGHKIKIHTNSHVYNVQSIKNNFQVYIESHKYKKTKEIFDYVVMATGHFYDKKNDKFRFYSTPWPYQKLQFIKNTSVGILGSSLSAIDAFVAIAHNHGTFEEDKSGQLVFVNSKNIENLKIVMLSRKGILPEADFYYPLPYEPLEIFTEETIEKYIKLGPKGLLERTFDLFKLQLSFSDPEYFKSLDLETLCMESFKQAYFMSRMNSDPFVWVKSNLNEAVSNYSIKLTIPWRYAILRMHEPFGRIVPHLSSDELLQFNTFLKPVFVDSYATVPHESIRRLLAAFESGFLDVQKLPEEYTIHTNIIENAVVISNKEYNNIFSYLIDATGNKPLSQPDFPFKTLSKQILMLSKSNEFYISEEFQFKNLDGKKLPFYCLSIPHLLNKFPFIQGLDGAYYIAYKAACNILSEHLCEWSS